MNTPIIQRQLDVYAFNARGWGAQANNLADDSHDLQRLMDDAYSLGDTNRVVNLDSGRYKLGSGITLNSGVSVQGAGTIKTILFPSLNTGAALTLSAASNPMSVADLTIDGTNCTGDAFALLLQNAYNISFRRVLFQNFTATSVATLQALGNGYGNIFDQCFWATNFRHVKMARTGSGAFPTATSFVNRCQFYGSTDLGVHLLNTAGIAFYDAIVQGNTGTVTFRIEADDSQEALNGTTISGGWWEENGDGTASSTCIDVVGTSGQKLGGFLLHGAKFYQTFQDFPRNQVRWTNTDRCDIRCCQDRLGAPHIFLKDGGGNSGYPTTPTLTQLNPNVSATFEL